MNIGVIDLNLLNLAVVSYSTLRLAIQSFNGVSVPIGKNGQGSSNALVFSIAGYVTV